MKHLWILFALAFAACSNNEPSHQTPKNVTPMTPLNLSIELQKDTFSSDEPIQVMLSIQNNSTSKLQVNGRFAPGYKSDTDRDIYFTVIGADGKKMEHGDSDVFTKAPTQSDVVSLENEETLRKTFNLRLLYPLASGSYRLVAHYNPVSIEGATAWNGEVDSDTVAFVVQ